MSNWIASAIKNKGSLHSNLGVPQGQKISESKLNTAIKSTDPIVRKRAILARTLRKFNK